jgi:hypothetical protein
MIKIRRNSYSSDLIIGQFGQRDGLTLSFWKTSDFELTACVSADADSWLHVWVTLGRWGLGLAVWSYGVRS